ncbi:MAG: porin family protein [Bacteroidota bacterium]
MTPAIKSFLLAVFCLFASSTFAQVSFGIKGGTNLAEYSFKENGTNIDQESINGFTLGAVLEIGLGGNVFLQPEAVFIQKGSKLEFLSTENKFNVNYLDIPVLLKIKILNSNLLNINLLGGPTFGMALNGEQTTVGGQTIDINIGGDNGLKRFDLGINAGGGVGINFGNVGVFGDVRYLFGVNNISEDDNREIRNKGLNLSVGLMFKILGR